MHKVAFSMCFTSTDFIILKLKSLFKKAHNSNVFSPLSRFLFESSKSHQSFVGADNEVI